MGFIVGVDIGGSHITCGLIDIENRTLIKSSIIRLKCDPKMSGFKILSIWKECIKDSLLTEKLNKIDGLGFAIPGPFDYENGISLIHNLNKFDSLFGVNMRQYFIQEFDLKVNQVKFLNDAACFALGEYFYGALKGTRQKCLFITIGTGFGSTFLSYGEIVTAGPSVPQNGWLYNVPFQNGNAEEYFSDKWILKRFESITGICYTGVNQISDESLLDKIYIELANNLAMFLVDWLSLFQAESLVVGGNVIKYKRNFLINQLKLKFEELKCETKVFQSLLFEEASLLGAASQISFVLEEEPSINRLTNQNLVPILKENISDNNSYSIYPVFDCGTDKISAGFDALVDRIKNEKQIAVDGYVGVDFTNLRNEFSSRLKKLNVNILWKEIQACKKSQVEIDSLVSPFLNGNDVLFGKKCNLDLSNFFREISQLKTSNDDEGLIIYLGIGSALIDSIPIIYFDVPKNEIQYRSRAKRVLNFCSDKILTDKENYKRFYFIDWPILNQHKCKIFKSNRSLYYVDDQHFKTPVWTDGQNLKESIAQLSESLIRVRPWFEPGVWGGNWIKNNIKNVNQENVNYAWSFELITNENGVIICDNKYLLEVSFDLLMFLNNKEILGESVSKIFKYNFPIRLDFLDTFGGDNLSIQCHPGKDYMQSNFNEEMPQDESYYILDAKENSNVYLGFQENINEQEFRLQIEKSFHESVSIQIENYIQSHKSKKHDFFSIPHGTIHGSGKNNLVLEISSAPYIFTFKIYDWLRLDLDGRPRTLNIDRAFRNLDFSRKGDLIKQHINNIKVIYENSDCKIHCLSTNDEQYYDVHRIDLKSSFEFKTSDCFSVLSLVEGDSIEVETQNGYKKRFYYAETFIIPAAAVSFILTNIAHMPCKLLRVFIKPEYLLNQKTY